MGRFHRHPDGTTHTHDHGDDDHSHDHDHSHDRDVGDHSGYETGDDRVMVLEHGKLVEVDQTEILWSQPQQAYTQRLLSAIPSV